MSQSPKPTPGPDEEGWVSSESGAGTPVNPENEDDDDDDDELDDDEILVLQTQRANRNAREAERLRAAMLAADVELRAKREEVSRTPPGRDSPTKHTNISPTRPPQLSLQPQPSIPKQEPVKSPPSVAPKAPVVQQAHIEDHTKHTFPTQHTPSPPPPAREPTRATPRHSDPPITHDFAEFKSNGVNGSPPAEQGTNGSRPSVRRALSHAPRPVSMNLTPARTHTQLAPTRANPSRPHPLIRAPTLLTKTTPSLPPLTAPPYLSAHSARGVLLQSTFFGRPTYLLFPQPKSRRLPRSRHLLREAQSPHLLILDNPHCPLRRIPFPPSKSLQRQHSQLQCPHSPTQAPLCHLCPGPLLSTTDIILLHPPSTIRPHLL